MSQGLKKDNRCESEKEVIINIPQASAVCHTLLSVLELQCRTRQRAPALVRLAVCTALVAAG